MGASGLSFRRVAPREGAKTLYLTFDDGPDPVGTPRVLALLAEFGAHATFFLIGSRARENPELVREIVSRGHAIGNHSPDHRYVNYFFGRERLKNWIHAGESAISEISGAPTIGFRPPAGVRTPELLRATREIGTPLILWQTRFYDSVFAPTPESLTRSLRTARPGDLILLHDSQRPRNLELFLVALRAYLKAAHVQFFDFRALERIHFDVEPERRWVDPS